MHKIKLKISAFYLHSSYCFSYNCSNLSPCWLIWVMYSLKKDNASNCSGAQAPAKGQKEALPGLRVLLVEGEGREEEGGREVGNESSGDQPGSRRVPFLYSTQNRSLQVDEESCFQQWRQQRHCSHEMEMNALTDLKLALRSEFHFKNSFSSCRTLRFLLPSTCQDSHASWFILGPWVGFLLHAVSHIEFPPWRVSWDNISSL